jgi:hypothetical protein
MNETTSPKRRQRRHISYCIAFLGHRPYVRVVWSDGSIETRYPGDRGYKSAKAAAGKATV